MLNIPSSLMREIKAGRFELGDGELILLDSKIRFAGKYGVEIIRNGISLGYEEFSNIVVNEGLNHILNVVFNGASQVATWYLAPFEGNYTPLATDTAATIVASSTECTAYTESTRQAFVEVTSTAQSTTNSASRATFTFNATKTIYGAFLASVSTKSSTSGTLISAAKFSTSKVVDSTDQLLLTYTITAADA